MSLKNLLAGGGSFFGVSTKEPTAYGVRKEAQLPVFGDVKEKEGPHPGPLPEEEGEKRVKLAPERSRLEKEPEERRRFLERRTKNANRGMTQAEMSLDEVRVVRNDLSEADLELAPRNVARTEQLALNPFAPRPIAAIGRPTHEKQSWAARMARLFGFLRPGRP